MKTTIKITLLLALAIAASSCMQGPKGEKATTGEATEIGFPSDAIEIKADLSKSQIKWLGTKPTGTHFGTIEIKDGTLYVKNGELLGGEFEMDMNSIKVLDLTDDKMNQNLVGHLKSADFFLVDSFPTASFKFATVTKLNNPAQVEGVTPTHKIEGNLTLRGNTKMVSFPALIRIENNLVEAITPQFILNRTDWGVNYGSKSIFANLKDNFIHDEMGITLEIKTN